LLPATRSLQQAFGYKGIYTAEATTRWETTVPSTLSRIRVTHQLQARRRTTPWRRRWPSDAESVRPQTENVGTSLHAAVPGVVLQHAPSAKGKISDGVHKIFRAGRHEHGGAHCSLPDVARRMLS
jgi:hypothetical protein